MTSGIKTDQIERKELARMPKKWDNHFVGGAPLNRRVRKKTVPVSFEKALRAAETADCFRR